MYFLSLLVALGCLRTSLRPSPFYFGLCLIVNGCEDCLVVLGFGGSILRLMVFLVYVGGILVGFVYTTVMSANDYPEALVSSLFTIGILLISIFMDVVSWIVTSY